MDFVPPAWLFVYIVVHIIKIARGNRLQKNDNVCIVWPYFSLSEGFFTIQCIPSNQKLPVCMVGAVWVFPMCHLSQVVMQYRTHEYVWHVVSCLEDEHGLDTHIIT